MQWSNIFFLLCVLVLRRTFYAHTQFSTHSCGLCLSTYTQTIIITITIINCAVIISCALAPSPTLCRFLIYVRFTHLLCQFLTLCVRRWRNLCVSKKISILYIAWHRMENAKLQAIDALSAVLKWKSRYAQVVRM